MKKRPRILFIIVSIFLLIVLSFPFQAAFLYGHRLQELSIILSKISLLNFLVALALLANIPLILRASRWLILSLPLTLILVGWNNWVVGMTGHDFSSKLTWVATGVFALLTGFIFSPTVWNLIREPKKRWWLQSLRRTVTLPMTIEPVRGSKLETKTYDLSRTGAFVSLSSWDELEYPMHEGDVINVKFNLGTINRISCSAKVIRRTDTSGQYPMGIGLHFLNLQRNHDRLLRRFVENNLP